MEEVSEQIIKGIEPSYENKEYSRNSSGSENSTISDQRRIEEDSLSDSEKQTKRNSDLQASIDQCSENLGDMLKQMEKVLLFDFIIYLHLFYNFPYIVEIFL